MGIAVIHNLLPCNEGSFKKPFGFLFRNGDRS